jgi:hypothetical protein
MRLNPRHLILIFLVWWVLMVAAYVFTNARIDSIKDTKRESGIEIIQEFSKLISVPLLERNIHTVHSRLVDVAKKADVVLAWVTDHQNEIVALTGTEQLLPIMASPARVGHPVSFWESDFTNHKKILNFTSDLIYAGTKIGKIYIALSAAETVRPKNQFKIVAVSSFLILLLFIIAMRYRILVMIPEKLKHVYWRIRKPDLNLDEAVVICPLCGSEKPFSYEIFKHSNPNGRLNIMGSKHLAKVKGFADEKVLEFSEQTEKEVLSWMKRQVILRCTEIIKKLAI